MSLQNTIEKAKMYIKQAEAILITAGAGMGVDSGLPDFRGDDGFWRAYPLLKEKGMSFEDMASPFLFETDPSLAWAFYGHRLQLYRDTIPHIGFTILKKWGQEKNNNYFIVTSNVDGQFQKAGFAEDRILEAHGSIHYMQCTHNCSRQPWSANDTTIPVDLQIFRATAIPICPNCHAAARPNILMFGDWRKWNDHRYNIQKQRYNKWLKNNKTAFIAIIEIGAGTAIPTIRIESEKIAKQYMNAHLIRINPMDEDIDKNVKRGVGISIGGLQGLKEIEPLNNDF